MVRYISPYSEIMEFDEMDIVTGSGLENIEQEGGTNKDGEIIDDGVDFGW